MDVKMPRRAEKPASSDRKVARPSGGNPEAGPRRTAKADAKRTAILKAAARIVCQKGYAEATLAEIGRAAGTFAGSIYYHFESREQVMEEVLNIGTTGVSKKVVAAVKRMPESSSYRERIRAGLRVHLSQMLLKDDFVVAYWRMIDQVPEAVREKHLAQPRAYGRFWKHLLQQAVEAGEIRPSADITIMRLVMLGASIWALDWFDPKGRLSPDDIADKIIDLLFDGVAA